MKTKTESTNEFLKKIIVARLDKPVGLSVRKGRDASNTTSGTTCTMVHW